MVAACPLDPKLSPFRLALIADPLHAWSEASMSGMNDAQKEEIALAVFKTYGYFYFWWIKGAAEFAEQMSALIQKLLAEGALSGAHLVEINGHVDMLEVEGRPEYTEPQNGRPSLKSQWAAIVAEIKRILKLDSRMGPVLLKVLMCDPGDGHQGDHLDSNDERLVENVSIVMNLTAGAGHFTAAVPKFPKATFPEPTIEDNNLSADGRRHMRRGLVYLHKQFFCKRLSVLGGIMVLGQKTWHKGTRNKSQQGQKRIVCFDYLSKNTYEQDPNLDQDQLYAYNGASAAYRFEDQGAAGAMAVGGTVLSNSEHNVFGHLYSGDVQQSIEYGTAYCMEEGKRNLMGAGAEADWEEKLKREQLFPRHQTPFLTDPKDQQAWVAAQKEEHLVLQKHKYAADHGITFEEVDDHIAKAVKPLVAANKAAWAAANKQKRQWAAQARARSVAGAVDAGGAAAAAGGASVAAASASTKKHEARRRGAQSLMVSTTALAAAAAPSKSGSRARSTSRAASASASSTAHDTRRTARSRGPGSDSSSSLRDAAQELIEFSSGGSSSPAAKATQKTAGFVARAPTPTAVNLTAAAPHIASVLSAAPAAAAAATPPRAFLPVPMVQETIVQPFLTSPQFGCVRLSQSPPVATPPTQTPDGQLSSQSIGPPLIPSVASLTSAARDSHPDGPMLSQQQSPDPATQQHSSSGVEASFSANTAGTSTLAFSSSNSSQSQMDDVKEGTEERTNAVVTAHLSRSALRATSAGSPQMRHLGGSSRNCKQIVPAAFRDTATDNDKTHEAKTTSDAAKPPEVHKTLARPAASTSRGSIRPPPLPQGVQPDPNKAPAGV